MVAAHLAMCPRCRAAVAVAEAVGGALLEEVEPAPVSLASLSATLARLDASAPPTAPPRKTKPVSVMGTLLPQPIAAYLPEDPAQIFWQEYPGGARFAELLRDSRGRRVGLMCTKAGAEVPQHGHTGEELTLILSGGFDDVAGAFRRGDVELIDENFVHAPRVDAHADCLALVLLQGKPAPVSPVSPVARFLRRFFPF